MSQASDPLRDAAEHPASHAAAPVRAHDDEIRVPMIGFAHDRMGDVVACAFGFGEPRSHLIGSRGKQRFGRRERLLSFFDEGVLEYVDRHEVRQAHGAIDDVHRHQFGVVRREPHAVLQRVLGMTTAVHREQNVLGQSIRLDRIGRGNNQNRAVRKPGQRFRHGALYPSQQATMLTGAHHDQIGLPRLRRIDKRVHDIAADLR